MNVRPVILAAAAVAALAASPSLAASVTVEYQDLDLSREKDRAILEQRLDAAARNVCGIDETKTGTRMPSASARSCYKTTRQSIDQQFAGMLEEAKKRG
jgi:UrcA family protein